MEKNILRKSLLNSLLSDNWETYGNEKTKQVGKMKPVDKKILNEYNEIFKHYESNFFFLFFIYSRC